MTELEKEAKEYFDKEVIHGYADNREELEEDCVNAYIAGAKEHIPQWHDLRKDPEDLPKTDADVVCYCGKEWRKVIGKYWREYKKWEVEKVVAWCELPKFEE